MEGQTAEQVARSVGATHVEQRLEEVRYLSCVPPLLLACQRVKPDEVVQLLAGVHQFDSERDMYGNDGR